MPFKIDDRWLWLGLGASIFLSLKAIHLGLQSVYKLSHTREEPKRFGVCTVSQDTEDAIRPESLKILATGNNYDIRLAATRILVDRFLCIPSEYASLSADLYSADPTKRDIARRTVKMIEKYADRSHIRRVEILKEQAGFQVARPSAPVPLPGALTDLEPGTQLMDPELSSNSNLPLPTGNARRRHREESPEEQALRRRRREAIVLNEGDRPLSQSDIIQRRTTG